MVEYFLLLLLLLLYCFLGYKVRAPRSDTADAEIKLPSPVLLSSKQQQQLQQQNGHEQ